MYTTFVGFNSVSFDHGSDAGIPKPAPRPRRRHQVNRACDWCRAQRIKCDDKSPCSNCEAKGRRCSEKGTDEVRTFTSATREIERLKSRVKELEEQLGNIDIANENGSSLPSSEQRGGFLPVNLDPYQEHGGNRSHWGSVHVQGVASSQQRQAYGPSSIHYFISRLNSYLFTVLRVPQLDQDLHLKPKKSTLVSYSLLGESPEEVLAGMGPPGPGAYLTRMQEEYFLDLFWQSYHTTYPFLDKATTRAMYDSLWPVAGMPWRRPCPLIDIVIALSIQYGLSMLARSGSQSGYFTIVDSKDAAIAGRWLYRRSQDLGSEDLESPTMTTLQCLLFSVVYLNNASYHNMAHSTLAMAIRTAVILGLHLEPPEEMLPTRRESRKRLWWMLYSMELRFAMKLGRPLATNISQVTCSLPAEPLKTATCAHTSHDPVSLAYNLHYIKLILTARAIYVPFYRRGAELLGKTGAKSLYSDLSSLEASAAFLLTKLNYLRIWLNDVPSALKAQRTTGRSFSTDRSSIALDPFTPYQTQRLSILLELHYHNMSMILLRPFILFYHPPDINTPLIETHAISCVNHAITLTNIIHQVLRETDLLNGWYDVLHWQWCATLCLAGYILAYPVAPTIVAATQGFEHAVEIFEMLKGAFVEVPEAETLAEQLRSKLQQVGEKVRGRLVGVNEGIRNEDEHSMTSGSQSDEPERIEGGGFLDTISAIHREFAAAASTSNNLDVNSYELSSTTVPEPSISLQNTTASQSNMSVPSLEGQEDQAGDAALLPWLYWEGDI